MAAPTSNGHTLAAALQGSEPLTSLMQRMRQSQARLAAVAHLLPAGLQGEVRAGPLDDSAWVLLVGNAAAAAKVRQMLPALQDAMLAQGFTGPPVKVRVLRRG